MLTFPSTSFMHLLIKFQHMCQFQNWNESFHGDKIDGICCPQNMILKLMRYKSFNWWHVNVILLVESIGTVLHKIFVGVSTFLEHYIFL